MKKELGREVPLERYRALMENFPICTVDVVLCNPDKTRALLGKRVNEPYAGLFYSFGGRLYKNEEFVDAALRIVQKETGLSLVPSQLRLAGVLNDRGDTSIFPDISYHAVNIYFGCRIEEGHEITLDEQHSEARWFEINDGTIHPYIQTRIKGVLRAL